MTDLISQKTLREYKRHARQALSQKEKSMKSQMIVTQLLQTASYQQANSIGAYLCLTEEVNVTDIIKAAWADNKAVYLPIVLDWGKPLKFARYTPETSLIKDKLAIDIPDVGSRHYIDVEQLDMVVTPLVAFDNNRNRIGMGGGFYDRTFAFKAQSNSKTTLVGVAFEAQRVEHQIKANEWDICPDYIISEIRCY
ncbi:MAG: 5-formyltetrahydrofolate cyclo-ligase [Ostreibacterium sp.]